MTQYPYPSSAMTDTRIYKPQQPRYGNVDPDDSLAPLNYSDSTSRYPPDTSSPQVPTQCCFTCFPVRLCKAVLGLALCGAGALLFPLVHLLANLSPFYFSLSFIGFTYFLLLSIPFLSTRIVPLRFQAGGRRRRLNLGLVCVLLCFTCVICIP